MSTQHPDSYANEDATQELLRISKWPEPLRLAYLLEKEMLWPLTNCADCTRLNFGGTISKSAGPS